MEAVEKQREAEVKAKQLQAELNKFLDSLSVKLQPRKKRKVIALHDNCIISAYFCCGIQVKPVVFDTSNVEKPTLNNTIGRSSKCIQKIQQQLVPHAIAYLGIG